MDKTGIQLLTLMFREGEAVCVSPNKWGYHSIPIHAAFGDEVTLLSTKFRDGVEMPDGSTKAVPMEEAIQKYPGDTIQLVALNPIEGWREDASCKKYRNFLIECDYGSREQQMTYVRDQYKMPFSAAVFSGGKSIHFLISLDTDLPDEKTWRLINDWILAILPLADQNCQNPSRSIRVPGAKRDDKRQELLEFRGQVSLGELRAWLEQYPTCKPVVKEKAAPSGNPDDISKIKPWARRTLLKGLDPKKSRNKQWFSLACEFAMAGFSEDHALDILKQYFRPDRDFKEREFLGAVASGFKRIQSGK